MATTKPRITVTLDQGDYDILAEFAKQQGCSMSSALSDIWKEAVPTIARVVKLIREANATKETIADRVHELAVEAHSQMMPAARDAIAQFDIFESEVLKAITNAKGGAKAGEAGRARTATPAFAPQSAKVRKGASRGRKSQ